MIGFMSWVLVGLLFIVIGVVDCFAKKPVGFWSNGNIPQISDVKRYNKAVGKLYCVFGVLFIPLGLPLLAGQNEPVVFISLVGAFVWVIALMLIYELGIVRKYCRK